MPLLFRHTVLIALSVAVAIASAPRCFTFEHVIEAISSLTWADASENMASHCQDEHQESQDSSKRRAQFEHGRVCECDIAFANTPFPPLPPIELARTGEILIAVLNYSEAQFPFDRFSGPDSPPPRV